MCASCSSFQIYRRILLVSFECSAPKLVTVNWNITLIHACIFVFGNKIMRWENHQFRFYILRSFFDCEFQKSIAHRSPCGFQWSRISSPFGSFLKIRKNWMIGRGGQKRWNQSRFSNLAFMNGIGGIRLIPQFICCTQTNWIGVWNNTTDLF